MKKILIPTDFSANANHAIDYAISLFDQKDIEICLLNTFYIPYASADVAYTATEVTFENARKRFAEESKRINKRFPDLKAKLTTKFEIGEVESVVPSLEITEDFYLIVMGTKGASGLKEAIIGSRTAAVVGRVKTPVLVVPEEAPKIAPKRILFAADTNLIDRELHLSPLIDIAKKHQSTINALHISKSDENKQAIKAFINYELDLNFIDIPHELNMETNQEDDIESAIKHYTERHPVDLMVTMTTKGNLFHNLFHRSVSKKMTFHTKIPLLVLHLNIKD